GKLDDFDVRNPTETGRSAPYLRYARREGERGRAFPDHLLHGPDLPVELEYLAVFGAARDQLRLANLEIPLRGRPLRTSGGIDSYHAGRGRPARRLATGPANFHLEILARVVRDRTVSGPPFDARSRRTAQPVFR